MNETQVVAALAALAQETRLRIFRLLVEAGPQGIAAGAISEALGVPPPTLSFHLTHMKHAGLVDSRRDSRSLIYAADFDRMTDLVGYLTENCCRGNSEACDLPSVRKGGPGHEALSRSRRR